MFLVWFGLVGWLVGWLTVIVVSAVIVVGGGYNIGSVGLLVSCRPPSPH